MKKYEGDLILGTFLTLLGVWCLYDLGLNMIVGWLLIIFGKMVIFVSVSEYSDRKRAMRGYDLSKDNKFKKKFRKLRKKRY